MSDRAKSIKARSDIWSIARRAGISLPAKTGIKFPSPFRPDKTPSCELWKAPDGEVLIRERTTGETFDSINLYARAKGITDGEAIRELSEPLNLSEPIRPIIRKPAPDKAQQRQSWPMFRTPSPDEIEQIAKLRNVSAGALEMLAKRGLLHVATFREGMAWIASDTRMINAQSRLMTGKAWPATPTRSETKALTLWGAEAAWPIGIDEAQAYPAIALTEGTPDFISVLHHALCEGTQSVVAPVMMAGTAMVIPGDALPLFAGKRIRVFIHDDIEGNKAAFRWAVQLQNVGCVVDGFDFAGLRRDEGEPIKDLNDLCRIDVDSWEEHRDIVEKSMRLEFVEGK
jgi:hypothetical protein